MTASFTQIRKGIATNLGSLGDPWQVSPYMIGNPTPPTIWVVPEESDYDEAMGRGLDCLKFTVQAFVGVVADQQAQARLDALLDPASSTSVKALVESDKTLGGAVQTLRVVKHHGYQIYEHPNVGRGMSHGQFVGSQWSVDVYV